MIYKPFPCRILLFDLQLQKVTKDCSHEMNLVAFPLLCLTILVQQTICQDEAYKKYSCDLQDIQKQIVDTHNDLRSKVKPAPSNMLKMEWNTEAAANAKKWAEQCKNMHSKSPDREITNFGCGENLYMSNRPHPWNKVMQGWFDEYMDFDYGQGAKKKGAVVGHYTQFVWYRSYQVGCHVAYCPNQALGYFYVCHYCPAGNAVSSQNAPYEAGGPCAKCEKTCTNGLCHNACESEDHVDGCLEYIDWCEEDDETLGSEEQIRTTCKATCGCQDKIH